MSEFDGAVAIVTGGASGIGAAAAALLAERGARVAVLDRDVTGVPEGLFRVVCDVTDAAQVDGAVEAVVEHFGALDIVINNAGIGAAGDVAANDDARVAPGARRECRGDRSRDPRRAASPAAVLSSRPWSTPPPSWRPWGCRTARSTRPARARCPP